jgi:hypothetical protein
MAKQGTGGRPSKQVKVVVPHGKQLYQGKGPGNPVRQPTTGGNMNPAPGALLPKNSPRKIPVTGKQ